MATRFDRVTTTPRRPEVELEELDLQVRALIRAAERPRTELVPPTSEPRELPTRSLAAAMMAWLGLVFGVCYVSLPLLFAALDLNVRVLGSVIYSVPAFSAAAFVAIVGATIARPKVRLDLRAARDPVVSAMLGGLGTWALVHNTSPLLVPFSEMGPVELVSFVAQNVLEMSLLGAMFASFTRSRLVAFALGSGFQAMILGFVLMLLRLRMML